MKTKSIFPLALFILIQSSVLYTQTQKGELTLGQTVTTEINPGEQHQYVLNMNADQFGFLRLMQQGVDIKISTFNPNGDKLEEFDSPNGKQGPELVTITSETPGDYIIEVSPFDENEPNGNYTVNVQSIKPKAVSSNERVDELFTAWNTNNSPGASVAVVKNGSMIFKNAYGMANLEYDIPNSPSTIFHIASVSKQFTVFSILLLEREGKLKLDDDIRDYIPEVPDFGHTITLRHLASHTSGLRDQWNLLAMAGWRLDDVITKEHVLKLVSRQKELNFNPGDEYTYCNTGFTLLAEVVARVSGQSFAEFTQSYIFEPLGMTNTLFYDDHEKIVKNRAYSYHMDGSGYKKSVLSYANAGATSLFTTVEDLSLWVMNFSNKTIGDSEIIEKMNTLAILNNGESFGGALGQFVGKYKGLNEIQHGGADAGYRTYLTRYPDEDFAVIVFSNAAEFNSGGMAHQIVDIYLQDKIEVEPEEEDSEEKVESEDIEVDSDILNTYVGQFELQPGFVITISQEDGQLSGQATGQPTFPLTPLSDTEFKVEGVEAKIEFVPHEGIDIELIRLHQGGQIMDAPRIKAFEPTSIDLSQFTGSFYSEELATTYHFVLQDDQLMAKHIRLNDFPLNPVKEDIFNGQVWFFGQVEFVRDSDNKITGCKVSSGRVRNLHFAKVH